jgi:hypothetical protein
MLDILFWIVFSLVLLIVIPDRWDARREIAKRQGRLSVPRGSEVNGRTIFSQSMPTARSRGPNWIKESAMKRGRGEGK